MHWMAGGAMFRREPRARSIEIGKTLDADSAAGATLPHPKPRQRRLEPAADPHRCDLERQSRRIVGLDRDAAQGCDTGGRLETSRGYAGRKTPQRLFLDHAD